MYEPQAGGAPDAVGGLGDELTSTSHFSVVDAAVAMSFALGVVEPYASGLGSEGYIILALVDGTQVAVDFRSWTPYSSPASSMRTRTCPIF